jgi:hypothetical protein
MRRVPRRLSTVGLCAFVALVSLLTMSACSGGFQGSKIPAESSLAISQPASVTVTAGQTATFGVTATGASGPFTYQWFANGTALPGATSSTYTTSSTTTSQSGTIFTVVVTSSAGSVTSSPATLTVNNSAALAKSLVASNSTPPYNGSVFLIPTFSGGTATIGSTGVGSSDITANAVSGTSYPTPALTAGKTYTLTVKDSKGDVVSTTCLVTPQSVALTPITPGAQTEGPGQVSFATTATGGLTNTVKWTANAGTFVGNVWTSPSTVGTYTITATSVDNPAISVTTTTTISGPVIKTQPVSQHDCSGGVLTLTVLAQYATGYQWNLNGSPISGATAATYSVPSASSTNVGNYTVTVTNGINSVTSSVAAVAVGSTITANPVSLSLLPTQVGTFSVAAQGLGPFTYQWYQIPSGGTSGTSISGANSPVYTTPAVNTSYNGAKYYAIATDSCSTPLNSANANLTVSAGNASPTIITQPVGQTVATGGTTSFTVVASGSGTLAYQWYVIPAGSTTATLVAGATSATYNVPATSTTNANNGDKYYVVVSNAYGQVLSQQATLAVGAGIQITQQPQTQYINVGDTATYTVAATSTLPLTYQWYEAPAGTSTFTAVSGATNPTLNFGPGATGDTGDVFKVVVSNGSSTATSNSAALFVGPLTQVPDLCNTDWSAIDNAIAQSGCAYQLTASTNNQHGELVWPSLVATGDMTLSFTMTLSNPSSTPADGFTIVLGDPSLGATPTSIGLVGQGLGAEGIPGLVFEYDDYRNAGEPPVPYFAVTRGETAQFENPYYAYNGNIPTLVAVGQTITHNYVLTIVNNVLTVTLDGTEVVNTQISPPPVAYVYVTASTGGSYETAVISNVSSVITPPPN